MAKSHHALGLAHVSGQLDNRQTDLPATRSIAGAIRRLSQAADALETFKANRSPLVTPEAHTKSVGHKGRQLDREVTATINKVADIHRNAVRELESRMKDKVNLKPHADAKEIRERFNGLKRPDKIKQMAEWVENNNAAELAAITETSPFLAGIGADEQMRFRSAITAKHAAEEVEALQHLAEMFDDAMIATRDAGRYTQALTDPAELDRIERAHEASQKSGDDFDDALA